MSTQIAIMDGVRSQCDDAIGEPDRPRLVLHVDGRYVVRLYTQAGHDFTEVDILDLLSWLRKNKPEFMEE